MRYLTCFLILLFLLISLSLNAQITIVNGHFTSDASGWDGVTVSGRENGPYQGTSAFQAINSSHDTSAPGSGSLLFTATASGCSLTQQLGITAQGQTLSLSADIAWAGNWTNLFFGFYEETAWDRTADCSFEIITAIVPADTDGTLDSFTRVTIRDVTLPTNGNAVRAFFGTSCSPNYSGAVSSTSIAVDNITPDYDPAGTLLNPAASVDEWDLY